MDVNVKKRTFRSDMIYNSILRAVEGSQEEYFAKAGLPKEGDGYLWGFLKLSSRAEVGDEADFQLAEATDDATAILSKFEAYLDTEFMDEVQAAFAKIRALDKPTSETSSGNV